MNSAKRLISCRYRIKADFISHFL